MKSKTIIISQSKGNGRGILTLYIEDDLLKVKLRLYSTPALNKDCKLGIYHNQQVYTANLIFKNGLYETSMVGDFDLDKDFYTALIDTMNNNQVILSGGTYAGYYFDDNSVFSTDCTPSTDTQTEQQEQPSQTCLDDQKDCEHCIYKQQFYQNTQAEVETNNTQPEQQTSNKKTLLENLMPQFEQIFKTYPNNDELNGLISNSRFVSVKETEQEYSLGVIYKDLQPQYICYAIKCNYNTPAPEEIGKFYQWVPIDVEDPLSEGYYIVYQDANDLKIIEV